MPFITDKWVVQKGSEYWVIKVNNPIPLDEVVKVAKDAGFGTLDFDSIGPASDDEYQYFLAHDRVKVL